MKKLIAFLLVSMALCPTIANALTLSELLEKYDKAVDLVNRATETKEKILRLIEESEYPFIAYELRAIESGVKILEPDTYVIGKDIQPGLYRIMYSCDSDDFSRITIITPSDRDHPVTEDGQFYFDIFNPFGISYQYQLTEIYIHLQPGYHLQVENGDVRLELCNSIY